MSAIGIDVGGVIMGGASGGKGDTSFFGRRYLRTPEIEGATAAIRRLVEHRFGEHVYIVSKAGDDTAHKTLEWMEHHGFFEATGVRRDHVYFCRERHEKAPICDDLGIDHFIDDKLEVLAHMRDIVPGRILFNPRGAELHRRIDDLTPDIAVVTGWAEVLRHLRV